MSCSWSCYRLLFNAQHRSKCLNIYMLVCLYWHTSMEGTTGCSSSAGVARTRNRAPGRSAPERAICGGCGACAVETPSPSSSSARSGRPPNPRGEGTGRLNCATIGGSCETVNSGVASALGSVGSGSRRDALGGLLPPRAVVAARFAFFPMAGMNGHSCLMYALCNLVVFRFKLEPYM